MTLHGLRKPKFFVHSHADRKSCSIVQSVELIFSWQSEANKLSVKLFHFCSTIQIRKCGRGYPRLNNTYKKVTPHSRLNIYCLGYYPFYYLLQLSGHCDYIDPIDSVVQFKMSILFHHLRSLTIFLLFIEFADCHRLPSSSSREQNRQGWGVSYRNISIPLEML